MKVIAQVKLILTPEQAAVLRKTLEQANLACQWISTIAWDTQTFRLYDLHHSCYQTVRAKFQLSAQMAVRAIAKVAHAYKRDQNTKRTFRRKGSIAYDDRILSWRLVDQTVSLWTVAGRLRVPFVCGDQQQKLLSSRRGESDLIFSNGQFFLSTTCEVNEPAVDESQGALGVDLGVINIAVDSDGEIHSARRINRVRFRHRRLRAKLQSKGSRSAKRKLKRLSGKERRFAKDTNHCISKKLVAKAKDTKRALVLEDLKGICARVTVRRAQRAILHSWSFSQLRSFVTYKAKRTGVQVFLVDPRNTSRTCPVCGHVAKANRPKQSTFSCVRCGFAGLADHIAAINIGHRAAINQPIVTHDEAEARRHVSQTPELRSSAVTSPLPFEQVRGH